MLLKVFSTPVFYFSAALPGIHLCSQIFTITTYHVSPGSRGCILAFGTSISSCTLPRPRQIADSSRLSPRVQGVPDQFFKNHADNTSVDFSAGEVL